MSFNQDKNNSGVKMLIHTANNEPDDFNNCNVNSFMRLNNSCPTTNNISRNLYLNNYSNILPQCEEPQLLQQDEINIHQSRNITLGESLDQGTLLQSDTCDNNTLKPLKGKPSFNEYSEKSNYRKRERIKPPLPKFSTKLVKARAKSALKAMEDRQRKPVMYLGSSEPFNDKMWIDNLRSDSRQFMDSNEKRKTKITEKKNSLPNSCETSNTKNVVKSALSTRHQYCPYRCSADNKYNVDDNRKVVFKNHSMRTYDVTDADTTRSNSIEEKNISVAEALNDSEISRIYDTAPIYTPQTKQLYTKEAAHEVEYKPVFQNPGIITYPQSAQCYEQGVDAALPNTFYFSVPNTTTFNYTHSQIPQKTYKPENIKGFDSTRSECCYTLKRRSSHSGLHYPNSSNMCTNFDNMTNYSQTPSRLTSFKGELIDPSTCASDSGIKDTSSQNFTFNWKPFNNSYTKQTPDEQCQYTSYNNFEPCMYDEEKPINGEFYMHETSNNKNILNQNPQVLDYSQINNTLNTSFPFHSHNVYHCRDIDTPTVPSSPLIATKSQPSQRIITEAKAKWFADKVTESNIKLKQLIDQKKEFNTKNENKNVQQHSSIKPSQTSRTISPEQTITNSIPENNTLFPGKNIATNNIDTSNEKHITNPESSQIPDLNKYSNKEIGAGISEYCEHNLGINSNNVRGTVNTRSTVPKNIGINRFIKNYSSNPAVVHSNNINSLKEIPIEKSEVNIIKDNNNNNNNHEVKESKTWLMHKFKSLFVDERKDKLKQSKGTDVRRKLSSPVYLRYPNESSPYPSTHSGASVQCRILPTIVPAINTFDESVKTGNWFVQETIAIDNSTDYKMASTENATKVLNSATSENSKTNTDFLADISLPKVSECQVQVEPKSKSASPLPLINRSDRYGVESVLANFRYDQLLKDYKKTNGRCFTVPDAPMIRPYSNLSYINHQINSAPIQLSKTPSSAFKQNPSMKPSNESFQYFSQTSHIPRIVSNQFENYGLRYPGSNYNSLNHKNIALSGKIQPVHPCVNVHPSVDADIQYDASNKQFV